jgi:hypothetical protein
MKRDQAIFDLACLVIVAAAITLGCATAQPRTRSVAQEFLREYSIGLHGAFSEAAAAIESGGIKTDVELLEFLQPRTEQARKQAAANLDTYMENNISNGELSRKDTDALRQLATQFREAHK